MNDLLHENRQLNDLVDPIVITAFLPAGETRQTAGNVLAFLIAEWRAEVVATLDSDAFYDYTSVRPSSRVDFQDRQIDWPETNIYLARPPGLERDVFMLIGPEPSFGWHKFVTTITDYLAGVGVKSAVNLHSFPASVPHTRAVATGISTDDDDLQRCLDIDSPGLHYDGPADIASALFAQFSQAGMQIVDLWTLEPDYVQTGCYVPAMMGLLNVVDMIVGSHTAKDMLVLANQAQMSDVDQVVASSEEMSALVSGLERRYDAGQPQQSPLQPENEVSPEPLPPTEDIIKDVERLLREQRHV